ncbi:A24 family peptidase [Acerihabitans sp. KWT182]|uniref:A24 family peptidase n=1 Tax=Acerihabitans sp. KWT182 TaxID=3157919 RepID=A0AAU7Q8R7_9GAMM
MLLFAAVPIIAGPTANLPGALLFGWFLLTLGWIDYFTLRLPDKLTGPLLACGLANHITMGGLGAALYEGMLGAISGGALLALVRYLFQRIKGYEGMGGGDVKLLAALGAWLGWQPLPALCFGASLCGLTVYAFSGRKREKIPFGPCLGLAGWVIYISP